MTKIMLSGPNPYAKSEEWKKQHSEQLKLRHQEGRYPKGVTKIGLWNQSQERKDRMKMIYLKNSLDKDSRGYGSEYVQRQRNRSLLGNKFQGEQGFIYLLDFPCSIKVGFSKDWKRRTEKQILGGRVILIISGPTHKLADLEFDTLYEFRKYTQLDNSRNRYTEFIDKRKKKDVFGFLISRAEEDPELKIEVKNYL